MENCIICLENIKKDSFLHKNIRNCNCNYKIHTLCLYNYISNNIENKKNVTCLTCKKVIIEYKKYKIIKNKVNSFFIKNKERIKIIFYLIALYVNYKLIKNIIYTISSIY